MGIALACLLPPIIHFCSGPLGPAIGGYFSGSRFQVRPREGLLVGLGMALLAIIPMSLGLATAVEYFGVPPRSQASLEIMGFLLLFYIAGLGAGGAVIGGNSTRHQSAEAQS